MTTKFKLSQFLLLSAVLSMLVSCGSDSEDPKIDCSTVNLTVSIEGTTAETCALGGTITVASTGGEGSHEYSIDGTLFQSTTLFNALDAGSYTVTVKDSNDCTSTVTATVADETATDLVITIESTTEATCSTGGSLTASATGGEGSLQYSVDGTTFQSSTTFDGLDAGTYTVTVRDTKSCTATVTATISSDPGNITFSTTLVDSGCGSAQGSITINASGGDGNYSYSIDGTTFGASNTFTDLAQGDYTVTVQDGALCIKTDQVKILSGTSFNNSIQPIITQSCAVTNCHIAGTGRQDFTIFSVIQANASGIKSRTQNGSMPATGSITQQEIDLIACWVDDGALNN